MRGKLNQIEKTFQKNSAINLNYLSLEVQITKLLRSSQTVFNELSSMVALNAPITQSGRKDESIPIKGI
jgi:hypothetical protein